MMMMNIIVCIKPIRSKLVYPDVNRSENFVINPYDLLALQETLKLKKVCECNVICLCMGELGAREVLVKCLAMGVDQVILLSDNVAFAGSDTVATSKILTTAIEHLPSYSLIVCGAKSIDGETGQVKYGIAERLNLNCIVNVEEILDINDDEIVLKSFNEDCIETVNAKFPILIAFKRFTMVNELVSILKLKQAQKKEITIWGINELGIIKSQCGLLGSKTEVKSSISLAKKNNCVSVEGSSSDIAKLLIKIINTK